MKVTAIEKTVLRLPKEDRAHLVNLLLDSLDEPSETDIQQLWLETSQRRASEIDVGKVSLVSGESLEERVQTILR
jgi:putative addiction module component (TIGR02574 family)